VEGRWTYGLEEEEERDELVSARVLVLVLVLKRGVRWKKRKLWRLRMMIDRHSGLDRRIRTQKEVILEGKND
jgi:hypothetical protein